MKPKRKEFWNSPVLRFCPASVLAMMLLGCAGTPSHVMLGTARPPISPESVKMYTDPPEKYEKIAAIDATSQGSLRVTGQQRMDYVIARMKDEAARLGANGILLQDVQDFQSGDKAAHGIAIFVPQ